MYKRQIQYNVLNLPSTVSFSDGSTITYTYGADGTKLRTVHKLDVYKRQLTGITSTRFTQNLYYNTGVGTARYNGSISSRAVQGLGTQTAETIVQMCIRDRI